MGVQVVVVITAREASARLVPDIAVDSQLQPLGVDLCVQKENRGWGSCEAGGIRAGPAREAKPSSGKPGLSSAATRPFPTQPSPSSPAPSAAVVWVPDGPHCPVPQHSRSQPACGSRWGSVSGRAGAGPAGPASGPSSSRQCRRTRSPRPSSPRQPSRRPSPRRAARWARGGGTTGGERGERGSAVSGTGTTAVSPGGGRARGDPAPAQGKHSRCQGRRVPPPALAPAVPVPAIPRGRYPQTQSRSRDAPARRHRYLTQRCGSVAQSVPQRKRSQCSQPIGGVRASPLSSASPATASAAAARAQRTDCRTAAMATAAAMGSLTSHSPRGAHRPSANRGQRGAPRPAHSPGGRVRGVVT